MYISATSEQDLLEAHATNRGDGSPWPVARPSDLYGGSNVRNAGGAEAEAQTMPRGRLLSSLFP
jgi:hypothetical protein